MPAIIGPGGEVFTYQPKRKRRRRRRVTPTRYPSAAGISSTPRVGGPTAGGASNDQIREARSNQLERRQRAARLQRAYAPPTQRSPGQGRRRPAGQSGFFDEVSDSAGQRIVAAADLERKLKEVFRQYGPTGGSTSIQDVLPPDWRQAYNNRIRDLRQRAEGVPVPGSLAPHMPDFLQERQEREEREALSAEASLMGVGGELKPLGTGNILSKTVSQILGAALYSPAGIVDLASTLGKDVISAAPFTEGGPDFPRSRNMAEEVAKSIYQDFADPAANPGYLLMDILGGLGAGAGIASRAGATLGRGAGSLPQRAAAGLRRPAPQTRDIGGIEVAYADSPLAAAGVKGLERMGYQPPGAGGLRGEARVGRERQIRSGIQQDVERGAPQALLRQSEGGPLRPGMRKSEKVAITIATDRVPPQRRIETHRREMERAEARRLEAQKKGNAKAAFRNESTRDRHAERIREIQAAMKHLDVDAEGLPVLKSRRLQAVADATIRSGARSEERGMELDERLTPEVMAERRLAHSTALSGGRLRRDTFAEMGTVPKLGQTVSIIGASPSRGRVTGIQKTKNTITVQITKDGEKQKVTVPLTEVTSSEAPRRWRAPEGVDVKPGLVYQSGSSRTLGAPTGPSSGALRGQVMGEPKSPIEIEQYLGGSVRKGSIRPEQRVRDVAMTELGRSRYAARVRDRETAIRESVSGGQLASRINAGTVSPYEVSRHYRGVAPEGGGKGAETKALLQAMLHAEDKKRTVKEENDAKDAIVALFGEKIEDIAKKKGIDLDDPRFMKGIMKRKETKDVLRRELVTLLSGEDDLTFFDARRVGLNLDEAPARSGIPGALFDTVNSLATLSVLLLKPGYLPPNLIGQAFLLYAQQGAVKAMHNMMFGHHKIMAGLERIDPDAKQMIRGGMGEGLSTALLPRSGRRGKSKAEKALTVGPNLQRGVAEVYNPVLDRRWREAAFLYEAKRRGYRTPDEIHDLLTSKDSDVVTDRGQTFQLAKRAMGEMDRLGPNERSIVRRIIFFYPWIKASTLYSLRFPAEHPVKTAVIGQLGGMAAEDARNELGKDIFNLLPGVFRVGEDRAEGPLVVDPRAAAIFQSPSQIVDLIKGLTSGDMGRAGNVGQYLSPVGGAGGAVLGYDPFRGAPYPEGTSTIGRLGQWAQGMSPQYLLYKRLTDPEFRVGDDRLFHYTPNQAIAQFAGGSASPRIVNEEEAVQRSATQNRIGMKSYERIFDRYAKFRLDALEGLKTVGKRSKKEMAALKEQTKNFTRLPEGVRTYLINRAKRDYVIDRLLAKDRDATPLDRVLEEVKLAARLELITPADAEAGLKLIEKEANRMSGPKLESYLRRQHDIVNDLLGYGSWEEYRDYLNSHNIAPPELPAAPRSA